MITEEQQKLISKLKSIGYGWAKFAKSVEASGNCSPEQHRTLKSMVMRTKPYPPSSKSKSYKHDISDCEAMQSGDYF